LVALVQCCETSQWQRFYKVLGVFWQNHRQSIGLLMPDAIFARNLLNETPAVAVKFVSAEIAALICLAIVMA